jgi:hypothetical protein
MMIIFESIDRIRCICCLGNMNIQNMQYFSCWKKVVEIWRGNRGQPSSANPLMSWRALQASIRRNLGSGFGELQYLSLLPLPLLPQRFTFSGPIYPDPEIRFSSCGLAFACLFHKWRERYPLQASRFPGSLEGDRSDRVRFRQGRRRVSMPWRICRGSGETQRKQVDIPFPSRYLPHANAPNAGAGHSCQCSFSSLSCLCPRLTTTCRSSCADHSGPPASAPPAAW